MNQTILVRLLVSFALATPLSACNKPASFVAPQEITTGTFCSLDDMVLADFAGPKGQIHYATGEPDYFCDTVEMFSIYLQPDQSKRITGIFTQDMGKADWEKPHGHWINAKLAYYVSGSKKTCSMGPTLAAFALQQDADKFAQTFGGKVLSFDQITPNMVDLTGGVVKDEQM
jgi:copper chaperone NosL